MMTSPRWGILAGHGVDAQAWRQAALLPEGPRWISLQQQSEISLIDLDGLVWLWQPRLSEEQRADEQKHFLRWAQALVKARQNRLVPIILVAVEPVSTLPEDHRHDAMHWLAETNQQLRHIYQRELQGWAPPALVDISRVTLETSGSEAGRRVTDAMERLSTTIILWQRQTHRRAAQCLAAALLLTGLYLSMLISTLFWKGSPVKADQRRDVVRWSPTEWQYHTSDCRQLLEQLQGRGYEQLSVPEQQRFTEHLRWLPISNDVLEQRRPTKEIQRWRSEVQGLLTQMETQLEKWLPEPAGSVTERVAQQTRARHLLEGVFEPRRPPTVLHRQAARYWQGERSLLVEQLRAIHLASTERAAARYAMLNQLKERLSVVEQCRVHSPELQTALLQEIQSSIAWLEALLAKPESSESNVPALLAESRR
jgi:hypothetical protein